MVHPTATATIPITVSVPDEIPSIVTNNDASPPVSNGTPTWSPTNLKKKGLSGFRHTIQVEYPGELSPVEPSQLDQPGSTLNVHHHECKPLSLQAIGTPSKEKNPRKPLGNMDNEAVKRYATRQMVISTQMPERFILNYKSFLFMHTLFALVEPELETINTLFTVTCRDLCCTIHDHWDNFIHYIETGVIPDLKGIDQVKENLQCFLQSNPNRAEELHKIRKATETPGWFRQIWPELHVILATASGPFSTIIPDICIITHLILGMLNMPTHQTPPPTAESKEGSAVGASPVLEEKPQLAGTLPADAPQSASRTFLLSSISSDNVKKNGRNTLMVMVEPSSWTIKNHKGKTPTRETPVKENRNVEKKGAISSMASSKGHRQTAVFPSMAKDGHPSSDNPTSMIKAHGTGGGMLQANYCKGVVIVSVVIVAVGVCVIEHISV
ncbi:hypothetical protein BKA83DRAFT_4535117 [Pisolithus microcarpus]|nr:hypothetical protein BKA83DRAFT_4535117 [Pisolithus microcarpus]